ncbi:hypothetical protein F4818DRAFT_248100 [Hypoxylon cercidicola]|nr:hypothetical protein F4818DRAFT_248100 [Hypoxylon cercidicola]
MASNPAFGFRQYLSTIDPTSQYEVLVQAGHPFNVIAQAVKTGPVDQGPFAGSSRLILKNAPSTVPVAGSVEPAVFSRRRQVVENDVLRLFDPGPLSHFNQGSERNVRVPKLLRLDLESDIIVTEDVTPLVTLWDILTPSSFENLGLSSNDIFEGIGADLGRQLGTFFAELHSDHTRGLIEEWEEQTVRDLKQDITYALVLEARVMPVLERLKTYGGVDEEMASQLFTRVLRGHISLSVPCFSHGYCHPGAILLPDWTRLLSDADASYSAGVDSLIPMTVVDWDFAQLEGRGIDGDMAQLLASLHCQIIYLEALDANRASAQDQMALLVAREAITNMCIAYSKNSRVVQFDGSQIIGYSTRRLLRSALILHGREMINQAVEREWDIPAESYIDKTDLISEMVRIGIEHLQIAGEDIAKLADNLRGRPSEKDIFIKKLFRLHE